MRISLTTGEMPLPQPLVNNHRAALSSAKNSSLSGSMKSSADVLSIQNERYLSPDAQGQITCEQLLYSRLLTTLDRIDPAITSRFQQLVEAALGEGEPPSLLGDAALQALSALGPNSKFSAETVEQLDVIATELKAADEFPTEEYFR